MSLQRICDINNCNERGDEFRVDVAHITIEPTGNNYESEERTKIKGTQADLCESHAQEYDDRIKNVLVKKSGKLFFPKVTNEGL